MGSVVVDCADPQGLARFWAAVTGYRMDEPEDEDGGIRWVMLRAPAGGPNLAFQRVPEPKEGKNRVHVDFYTADEQAEAARIEALGATRQYASEDPDDVFIVLADPEGNEFCVCDQAGDC